ncbi:GNAT family N-acetyltransferase [Kutzneria chonburiensis]|uniref:GNAT family N-acetyltransferase n=1 Tax=Kutzneria chonburiensis TaxID=1483604 RepID=A0ABV6MK32_9PSEU|nr:GNAT family N-acetyltransferase [Kutzneria chonburiensis]
MKLSIKVAQPDELSAVLEILDDAAGWLQTRGIDQWPASFTADATWRTDRIRSYIEHGMTFLARNEAGQAVATVTLSKAADPQFAHGWPDGPETGGYVFRMAVRRSAAGNDIGGQLLDWASSQVATWGKKWLRLDVHRFNQSLQEYYKRHGFAKIAEVTAPDLTAPGRTRGSGALMQRAVGSGEHVNTYEDVEGLAAAWLRAASFVDEMRRSEITADYLCNEALETAASALEKQATPIAAEAAAEVRSGKVADESVRIYDSWNVALEQASRGLEVKASHIRQANGMYYRSLTGKN